MPLYWFLLVILSLACGSLPTAETTVWQAMVASLGMILGWTLLAKLAAFHSLQTANDPHEISWSAVRAFERQLSFFRWSGLAIGPLCLIGFGLAGVIDRCPPADASMAIRASLLFCPALLLNGLLWWIELDFAAAHRLRDGGWKSAIRETLQVFRTQGAWLVIPVLLLLLLVDLIQCIPGVTAERSGWVLGLVAIVFVPLVLPHVIRGLWPTESIGNGPHAWLRQVCSACRMPSLSIRMWQTGNRSGNALVVGFLPGFRFMLISDRLLNSLPADQLTMVALHELSHLRRFHMPMRMLAVFPAFSLTLIGNHFAADYPIAEGLGLILGLLTALGCLHLISYWTELDADRHACRLAVGISASNANAPQDLRAATESLITALDSITAGNAAAKKGSWLHPSIARRKAALRHLALPMQPVHLRDHADITSAVPS